MPVPLDQSGKVGHTGNMTAKKKNPKKNPKKEQRLTKTADAKGRVTLGAKFARRTVLVTPVSDTEVLITLARVIPEREQWLFKNKKALASIRRALAQAKAGQFSKNPPDLKELAKLADSIPDDE